MRQILDTTAGHCAIAASGGLAIGGGSQLVSAGTVIVVLLILRCDQVVTGMLRIKHGWSDPRHIAVAQESSSLREMRIPSVSDHVPPQARDARAGSLAGTQLHHRDASSLEVRGETWNRGS